MNMTTTRQSREEGNPEDSQLHSMKADLRA